MADTKKPEKGNAALPKDIQPVEMDEKQLAKLEDQLRQSEMAEGGRLQEEVGPPRINVKDGPDELQCVILAANRVNTYWANPYEGESSAPDCFSADSKTGVSRKDDEGDPILWAKTEGKNSCKTCPYNQWGSSAKGKGKACRNGYQVWILREPWMLPELLMVPPTSLRSLSDYLLKLIKDNILRFSVMTQVKKEAGKKKGMSGFWSFSKITTIPRNNPLFAKVVSMAPDYQGRVVGSVDVSDFDADADEESGDRF